MSIPIFTTVESFRSWRHEAFGSGKSVGFIPTMGALHQGHLSLVRRSLEETDLTVISIFVNPAQFAPHEDLDTYPRTLQADLDLLTTSFSNKKPSAIFAPTSSEMYPSGITQSISDQKGTFIQIKGYDHQMEGTSRPNFFRGVATVVTKLFNVVQPTKAYFGQKDIQQALILKRMVRDLLLEWPGEKGLVIVPTERDEEDGLALSSRNAYLTREGRRVAPTLRKALLAVQEAWEKGGNVKDCLEVGKRLVDDVKTDEEMRLDYIALNDADTFDPLSEDSSKDKVGLVILSGALWVGKTRLIDNILLGDTSLVFN